MKKSFTLIELIISVGIIAILISVAIPIYDKQILKTRFEEAKSKMHEIALAQERYKSEYGSYFVKVTSVNNENTIAKNLNIVFTQSNNFMYSIKPYINSDYYIQATLRFNDGTCDYNNHNVHCKQLNSLSQDPWIKKYNRSKNNHYLEFYPNRMNKPFTDEILKEN